MYPFKAYNSAAFSVFTNLYDHHRSLIPKHCQRSPKKPPSPMAVTPPPSLPPGPISLDFPLWTFPINGIIRFVTFVSFPWHNVFSSFLQVVACMSTLFILCVCG